ncbi:MAG TPA: hypothetical protein VMV46_18560 [Thermoanaerobaculia bacterium]|jgi:hypothetical protein|nr:hypothetical protein [Thermoanaerobaculia bacterium]
MSTLSLDSFWSWLLEHPNCVVRAGSADAVLYDDDDLHWWLGKDGNLLIAQVIRGKRLAGELVIDPERVSYVENVGEQREGEHAFELISETETERYASFFFVLTHGFETEGEDDTHDRAIH